MRHPAHPPARPAVPLAHDHVHLVVAGSHHFDAIGRETRLPGSPSEYAAALHCRRPGAAFTSLRTTGTVFVRKSGRRVRFIHRRLRLSST